MTVLSGSSPSVISNIQGIVVLAYCSLQSMTVQRRPIGFKARGKRDESDAAVIGS